MLLDDLTSGRDLKHFRRNKLQVNMVNVTFEKL